MSIQHHNAGEEEAMQRFIDEVAGKAKLKWPLGRISGLDDGESAFAIAADHKNHIVHVQFTKPMNWIGLDPKAARHMGNLLLQKADEIDKATTPHR